MKGPVPGSDRWYPRPGMAPTRRNLDVLAATIRWGTKGAASKLGMGRRTVAHHISDLLIRLDVADRWGAVLALGWLRIPDDHMQASDPGGTVAGTGEGAGVPSPTHGSLVLLEDQEFGPLISIEGPR